MSRIVRLGVLTAALLSLFAVASSTAGAVTWHNTGDTAFTATSGPTTLTATGTNLTCSNSSWAGTVGAAPFVGVVWTAATGTGAFTNCVALGIKATTSCTFKVTGTTWTAGPPAVMGGNADVTCTSYVGGSLNCITEGSTPGTYTNPSGSTMGSGIAPVSNTLKMTNGASACMLGHNVQATITATPLTITAASGGPSSPHAGPIVTRTA
ncbi:hypothetical protein [Baekduia sp. Peel2402]|uniref:hypothetical protein n=1 Tax=Baekduia sp. Peel2402 TaxID=3458296 RepID=UPI00403E6F26